MIVQTCINSKHRFHTDKPWINCGGTSDFDVCPSCRRKFKEQRSGRCVPKNKRKQKVHKVHLYGMRKLGDDPITDAVRVWEDSE